MPRHAISLAAAIILLVASGCGYLDEDILLSEQDFEESLGAGGTSGSFVGAGVGMSTGCGIGGGYASYASHVSPITLMLHDPMHIHASLGAEAGAPAAGDSRGATPSGGQGYARAVDDEPQQEQLHTGLETWGQYLEAEMERAR